MKWCENCKVNRESWAERGHLGENYDKRCWSCDNFTLKDYTLVKYEHTRRLGCNPSSGGWHEENTYRNEDGSSTTTYIQRGDMNARQMRMEVPPKRSSNSDCKIL